MNDLEQEDARRWAEGQGTSSRALWEAKGQAYRAARSRPAKASGPAALAMWIFAAFAGLALVGGIFWIALAPGLFPAISTLVSVGFWSALALVCQAIARK